MEEVDRGNSFSTGMEQPDGNWNRWAVAQEGENLALMTWKEERKSLMSPTKSNGIIWQSSIPFPHKRKRVSKSAYKQNSFCLVCLCLPTLGQSAIFLHLYKTIPAEIVSNHTKSEKRTQTAVLRPILRQT